MYVLALFSKADFKDFLFRTKSSTFNLTFMKLQLLYDSCINKSDWEDVMSVRVEKNKGVWTIIHSRPESRNAMDPLSADQLTDTFLEFNNSKDGKVAVFWGEGGAFCAGWDLKFASALNEDDPLKALDIDLADKVLVENNSLPRGPMGPSRLNLKKTCNWSNSWTGCSRWDGISFMV